MALQSQTYANSGDGYYIEREEPVIPGNTAIRGPLEILPASSASRPLFYNIISQTDTTGLTISENQTGGGILSEIVMRPASPSDILLTTYKPGSRATLQIGTQATSDGEINVFADDGLYIKNFAGSGTALQLVHTSANKNVIQNKDGTGARMEFDPTTRDIRFRNSITPSVIVVANATNAIVVRQDGDLTGQATEYGANGIIFRTAQVQGRIGPLGGTDILIESATGVSVRTNSVSGTPNQSITANQDGTVDFLSIIRSPFATISNTLTALVGSIGTLTNTGSMTSPSATITNLINTTATITNATIATLTNTISMSALSANIVSITGLTAINTIPINEFAVPTGSMFAWCKYIPTPPSGYLICNGAQYSQSSFPNLYAVIGNTYNQPLPSPGNFRVPNMNGRVPMGTVITDDNLPPGNERINVTVTASVAVNTPTGVRNGLYCVYTDGAIYENMICTTAGMVTGPIDAIIYDTVPANAGYFVILPRNFTTFSGPFGNAQFYFDTNTRAFQAPSIANNFTFGASRGFSMYPQATDEVGVHNHGTVATGSTNNASAASGRSEPNFSVPDNQGIYNFTPPGGSPQNASAGLRYIPPNTSTWWIIKT